MVIRPGSSALIPTTSLVGKGIYKIPLVSQADHVRLSLNVSSVSAGYYIRVFDKFSDAADHYKIIADTTISGKPVDLLEIDFSLVGAGELQIIHNGNITFTGALAGRSSLEISNLAIEQHEDHMKNHKELLLALDEVSNRLNILANHLRVITEITSIDGDAL